MNPLASSFWFPADSNYASLIGTESLFTNPLYICVMSLASVMVVAMTRHVIELLLLVPLTRAILPVLNKKVKYPFKNKKLEQSFTEGLRKPSPDALIRLEKSTGKSQEEIADWFTLRRSAESKNASSRRVADKFTDNLLCLGHHCLTLYSCAVILGFSTSLDITKCWENYPEATPSSVTILYMFQIGFYGNMLLLGSESKQSLPLLTTHAILSLFLLQGSLMTYHWRFGVLVLGLHTSTEVIGQFSRILNYLHYSILSKMTFLVFGAAFFCIRLYIFPLNVLIPMEEIAPSFPALRLFQGLLVLLVCINFYWGLSILSSVTRILSGK